MFCREQVAQLRPMIPEVESLGARFAVVGNGTVAHAAWFVKDQKVDFEVRTDPTLKVYELADFKRTVGSSFNPKSLSSAVRALKGGFRQSATKGDALQQGGAMIVLPDGRLAYKFVSEYAGHHPRGEEMIATLRHTLPRE